MNPPLKDFSVKYLSSIHNELTSQPRAGCTSKRILDVHSVNKVPSARQQELQLNLHRSSISASAQLPETTRSTTIISRLSLLLSCSIGDHIPWGSQDFSVRGCQKGLRGFGLCQVTLGRICGSGVCSGLVISVSRENCDCIYIFLSLFFFNKNTHPT